MRAKGCVDVCQYGYWTSACMCVCVCACVCVASMLVCVCVCVRERDARRKTQDILLNKQYMFISRGILDYTK